MTKLTLNSVGSLIDATTAAVTINNNSSAISTAMENTLSRDGTSPNQMAAIIDMNSNQIVNLPNPITPTSPLRLQDLSTFVGGGTVTNIPPGGLAGAFLIKNSNTNYDVAWTSAGLPATSVTWTPTGTGGTARNIGIILQERGVCVTDYGAIPNSNVAGVAATNALAFARAFAASSYVYGKLGDAYYSEPITIPTSAKCLKDCTIFASGTYGGGSTVISIIGNTSGFILDNCVISVDLSAYTTTNGVSITDSSNIIVQKSSLSGLFAVFVSGASDGVEILNNKFIGGYGRAVWATCNGGASAPITMTIASPGVFTATAHGLTVGKTVILYTNGTIPTPLQEGQLYYVATVPTANTFTLATLPGGASINTSGSQSSTHYFTANGPTNLIISGNYVKKNLASAHLASTGLITTGVHKPIISNNTVDGTRQWGAACTLGAGCIITNNTVSGSEAEAVTSSSVIGGLISNNMCMFDATHDDTGLSISNSDGPPNKYMSITGNTLVGPRNGAMLIGTGAQGSTISGNTIISPNLIGSTLNAGITLDGSNTVGNFIGPNSFGGDLTHVNYQVSEANFTGGGTPSGNYITQQIGASGTTIYLNPSSTTQLAIRGQSSANSTSIYNGFRFEATPLAIRDVGGINVNLYDYDGSAMLALGSSGSPILGLARSTYNFYTNGFAAIAASLTGGTWTLATAATPSSPSAGNIKIYGDSTANRFHDVNPSGVIGTTVVADTGAANQFLTAVSTAGVISKAQPAIADISGLATAWTSYTPTVTSSVNTITTKSATGFYKQVGKSITVRIEVIITTNGTGAGRVEATLPVAVAAGTINQALTGWSSGSAAVLSAGIAPGSSTTKALIFTATGTYPGADNVTLNVQGTYEVP